MPGVSVDGTDFFSVYEAAGAAVERARQGGGPTLLECQMVRFFGHFEGDQQTYRAKGEVEAIRNERDCIKLFAQRVMSAGVITADEMAAIDREVLALIDDAVAKAMEAPAPAESELLTDVYVTY